MKQIVIRVAAVAAMFAAFAVVLVPQAGATPVAEFTVHHRLCGDNYKGGSEWDECHDVLVGTPFDFTIDGPMTLTVATDVATGNAEFGEVQDGTYHLFGGVPGEFSNQTIYCSDQNTGNPVNVSPGPIGVYVEVPLQSSVVCDVYEFPEDLRGDPEPTPTQVPKPEPTKIPDIGKGVTHLPNTGAGDGGMTLPVYWLVLPALAALGFGVIARKRIVVR